MKRQAVEFRITLMTIVIVVVFLVCNSFESLLFILHSQELLYRNIVENYLRPICDVLMVFNSSVNVFIYGTVSTQFRAAFYEMFSCLQIRVSERMSCKQLKSDNLQYNTLGRWVTGTNDSSTKHLMFQVLFFFHNFLQNSLENSFQYIFLFFLYKFTKIKKKSFECPNALSM